MPSIICLLWVTLAPGFVSQFLVPAAAASSCCCCCCVWLCVCALAQAGSLLTYDIVLSPYPALPPLERLRQHLVWSLQEKKTLPEEFSLAGSARLKPYAFEEDEDEAAADEAEAGAETTAGAAAEGGAQRRASGAAAAGEAEPKQEALGEAFWKYFKKAGRLWKAWRNYLDVSAGNVATLTATIPPNYRSPAHLQPQAP